MGCGGSDDSADTGATPEQALANETANTPEPLAGSMSTPGAVTEYASTTPTETAPTDTTGKMEELLRAELGGDAEAVLDRAPPAQTGNASLPGDAPGAGSSGAVEIAAPPVDETPAPVSTGTTGPSNASTLLQRAEAYAQENKDYKVVTTLRRVDDSQLSAAERERKTTLYRAASDKLASSEKGLADQ